jgi:aspartyl/asparaginyl beta-hydroxylase (cupin superfamily)
LPNPLPARFAEYIGGINRPDQRGMLRYPDLPAQPWHDPSTIELARDLEEHAPEIITEYRALDPAAFHPESEGIGREGAWDVLFLFERGRRHDETCSRCPVTTGVIERHRSLRTLAGLAYFSRLAPHSRVAAHHGLTNMRLRCHLGIDVPADCGIRVDGSTRTWEAGKCLVFDDYFLHDVWNDSDHPRIVLIVDIWHPGLTDDEVELLDGLQRYAANTGQDLRRYWARNEAARRGPRNR